jgi:NADH-quinone oxidoreductase subunit G
LAAQATGATLGFLPVAADTVGAELMGVLPGPNGLNATQMLAAPRRAYVLLGVEPEVDAYDAAATRAALLAAEFSVALTAFRSAALEECDVLLPIAAFTETAGSFVSGEGRLQSFHAAVKPLGESRPAWKVLRVLGNLLSLSGFDYDTVEAVRADALPQGQATIASHLDNGIAGVKLDIAAPAAELVRLGETGLYQLDPLTRRAPALQATAAAQMEVSANGQLLAQLGLQAGTPVRLRQNGAEVLLDLHRDDRLADGVLRVPAHANLGARFGAISVERA